MQTIIVPIDFSFESMAGLKVAILFATKSGSNIQMIHVMKNSGKADHDTLNTEYQVVISKFEKILKDYSSLGKLGFTLSYTIKEGKIFKEVINLAEKRKDSLIVLSTHGESGFEEFFIGGDAFKIVSHSKCPVITIRGNALSPKIEKIVMPLDINFQTREKVPFTVKLAKMFGAEIHLLTINTSKSEEFEEKLHLYAHQMVSYIKSQYIPYVVKHLQGDNFTDLTLEYSNSVGANLISIMTEQDESFSNLLMGSYAHQMINKASIPVLLFPVFQISSIREGFRTTGSA